MTAHYRFVDVWHLDAPPERVYEVLSCPREYPDWWGNAFLEAEGDAGPAAPGKRARLVTRGLLPYRLRWELECVDAVAPRTLVSRLSGDFEGEGIWTFEPLGGGTRATLEWRPRVTKPLVRRLTPLLRPLFAWNHRWAMRRGYERISALLTSEGRAELVSGERAEPLEARPQPVAPVR
jgi:uncharacterized protein YndB with AHSA1/START domain